MSLLEDLEIKLTTTTETGSLQELLSLLQQIKDEGTDVGDAISESLSNVSTEADNAVSSLDDLNTSTSDASSEMDNLGVSADSAASSVETVDNGAMDNVKNSTEGAKEAMDGFSQSADEASSKVADVSSNADSLSALESAAGVAALGVTIDNLANAAGNYHDSYVKMGLAFDGVAMSAEQAEQKYSGAISRATDSTGRSAGAARTFFTQMAISGVKNLDLIEKSFEGVSAAAFALPDATIESTSKAFQNMTLTGMAGVRQLKQLGLTSRELGVAMGIPGASAEEVSKKFKSMDANTRASVLNTALATKYGEETNEAFKNSWEGLTTQLGRAMDGFARLVGEILLPAVIPALSLTIDVMNGLSAILKGLPGPVRGLISVLASGVVGIVGVGLAINTLSKVAKTVLGPFKSLANGIIYIANSKQFASLKSSATSAFNTMKSGATSAAGRISNLTTAIKANTLATWSNFKSTVSNTAAKIKNGLANAATAVKEGILTAARWAATAAQTALNFVMALNPIVLVVIAIVALIAILAVLYNKNETVRNAINGLWNGLKQLGGYIYSGLIGAWNALKDTVTNLWATLQENPILDIVTGFITFGNPILFVITHFDLLKNLAGQLWNALMNLGSYLTNFAASAGASVNNSVNNMVQGFFRFLVFLQMLPIRVWMYLNMVIMRVVSFGVSVVARARTAGQNLVNGFINYVKQLPGKVYNEFMQIGNRLMSAGSKLVQQATEIAKRIVSGFLGGMVINSPGIIQIKTVAEFTDMLDRIGEQARPAYRVGGKVAGELVKGYGNVKLGSADYGYGFNNLKTTSNTSNQKQNGIVINNPRYEFTTTGTTREQAEEIYKFIVDKMKWDNITAGRTV